ncbi:dehydrase and lipid transport-domain-containing protein [Bisporella sp. PMI_857]|nr:dehydrase and lipid transport-domain-containing protein [Bisporella sp. PMI_857]
MHYNMSIKALRSRPLTLHSRIYSARRSFVTLPGAELQTLHATRILPYKASSLYTLITDIDKYSNFVPYCLASKVTKWSTPDQNGKCWPAEADLKVGWGGYEETFTSRLFCIPGSIIEALSGEASTSLLRPDILHHSATPGTRPISNSVFKSLSTKWKILPFPYKPPSGPSQPDKTEFPACNDTEVHLTIEFQFANPIYAVLSKAVAPKIAGMMVEAFEAEATRRLGSLKSSSDNNELHYGHESAENKRV